jgi:hypothetical protein
MASTSVTNASVDARPLSDDDERGSFFFGRLANTLVELGLDLTAGERPRCHDGRVHAAGCR